MINMHTNLPATSVVSEVYPDKADWLKKLSAERAAHWRAQGQPVRDEDGTKFDRQQPWEKRATDALDEVHSKDGSVRTFDLPTQGDYREGDVIWVNSAASPEFKKNPGPILKALSSVAQGTGSEAVFPQPTTSDPREEIQPVDTHS